MTQYTVTGRISSIETTEDRLTGRGGIALFARYLSQIGLQGRIEARLGFIRKGVKGLSVWSLFVQVLCWLFDGTSSHLSYFDDLTRDAGYAGLLDHDVKRLASSHTIKRFIKNMINFMRDNKRYWIILVKYFKALVTQLYTAFANLEHKIRVNIKITFIINAHSRHIKRYLNAHLSKEKSKVWMSVIHMIFECCY